MKVWGYAFYKSLGEYPKSSNEEIIFKLKWGYHFQKFLIFTFHDNIILYYKMYFDIIANYLLLDYNNRHNSQYTTQFTIIQKDFNKLLLKSFQLLVNNWFCQYVN